MKRIALLTILVLSATVVFTSCSKDDFTGIEGLSFANYPKVDGSTSARALHQMVACKLLGIPYEWRSVFLDEWFLIPKTIPAKHEKVLYLQILQSF